ncbi:MAG: hypothetical protein AVDCRST_MAG64-1373 [uncultured Phycisphaerae bacterium]|uniref:Blue (type 1) copper domain-containing protein n=1 Tax=uncultured Phycisphaerae bacterium TaxID=904963 RepID=A0A6J4NRA8_9BACT|nr:MAG: hypothetical protein AVDCRST_MAG64-1373 [uncultured Phycisphaerae bacterium]
MIVLSLIVVAVLAAAAPAGAERTKGVSLADVEFKPGTVTIRRGDRVRWTWKDGPTPHNVRSRGSRRFKGSSTKTDGTHSARFRRRGTYRYVCTVHIGMDGKVVVR